MALLSHLRSGVSWATALALGLSSVACGEGAADEGKGGAGGTAGSNHGPTSLVFSPSGTLTLVPGEVRSVTVVATPPGSYVVRWALLGDSVDAALDKSETTTDSSGRADVALTAPSSATTFSVRASIEDKVTASIPVSVSASGFGSLQVSPSYAGKRSVSHWVASVRTGVTCAEISGELLKDGDLKGTAPSGKIPQVDDIPVGPALAVTLRGAESIAGCKDVSDLRAGTIDAIKVSVFDLPMTLEGAELDVVLGLDAKNLEWSKLLLVDAALQALSPASNDAAALLDAMHGATPDSSAASAFTAARKSNGWDGLLATALGGTGAIRNFVKPWLEEGAQGFASPDAFRARLTGAGSSTSNAWFELTKVGSADALDAGFPQKYLASWQANPDDSVALGLDLTLLPSRLSTALALAPAKADVPSAASVPDALAELLSCKTVAQTLVGAGTAPGQAYSQCDASCSESLCRVALAELWAAARDASAAPSAPFGLFAMAATADAGVDDFARPSSFAGTWVGTFDVGGTHAPLTGSATAKKPGPPE